MFAIKGIYDGGTFTMDRPMPVAGKHEVIITFLEADRADEITNKIKSDTRFRKPQDIPLDEKLAAYKRLVGLTAQNPVSIEEARSERLSRQ
ncbi:hypothetical protein FACS189485_21170 [Spirochaetia bacterium]|nr:hypothetical protein FACS1894163_02180 [Spirochaetia bacterium]GHV09023.1 hypothetical protein FACS189485_21170 [Spirochaetia bacterium]